MLANGDSTTATTLSIANNTLTNNSVGKLPFVGRTGSHTIGTSC